MLKKFTEETLNKFGKPSKSKLATASTEDLIKELLERERSPIRYPIEVFPEKLHRLINVLHSELEIETSYIGTSILALAGMAIGNCLKGGLADHMQTTCHGWYCLLGDSSSGKSWALSQLMDPFFKIDSDFKKEFEEQVRNAEDEKKQSWELAQKALIVQNITFESFIRDKVKHNPKGLLMFYDELTEWVDNFAQFTKSGKESPFVTYMLSSWNNFPFTMDRAGNKNIHIPAMQSGVSVIGGTQPNLVHTFFGKLFDRGYTNRMLFAIPEKGHGKMLLPNPYYTMDQSCKDEWSRAIMRLYFELPFRKDHPPIKANFTKNAVHTIFTWQTSQKDFAESTDDLVVTRSIVASYLGKINLYVARWAMILAMLERALGDDYMEKTLEVRADHGEAATKIADYYIETFREVYKITLKAANVPMDVAQFVFLFKNGEKLSDISRKLKLCGKKDASGQAHTMAAKRKAIEIIASYPGLLKADEIFHKAD